MHSTTVVVIVVVVVVVVVASSSSSSSSKCSQLDLCDQSIVRNSFQSQNKIRIT